MTSANIVGYEFADKLYADLRQATVFLDGRPLAKPLPGKEFEVLVFFLEHPRTVIPRDEIAPLNEFKNFVGRHPADDYISKIVKKLEWKTNQYFKVLRGIGYSLECSVHSRTEEQQERADGLHRVSMLNLNHHSRLSMDAAVEQSLEALRTNPNNVAEASVTLAYNYINLCHAACCAELPSSMIPKAKDAAEDAVSEKPDLAAGHGALGLISLIYDYDWHRAAALLRKALALDPMHTSSLLAYGHLLITSGSSDEGLALARRAVALDPTKKIAHATLAWFHLFAKRAEEAWTLADKAVFLFPDFSPAHNIKGWIEEELGRHQDALATFLRSLSLETVPITVASLGHVYGLLGNERRALSQMDKLQKMHLSGQTAYLAGYCKAVIYSGLQDEGSCLAALEEAFAQRCDWLIHLKVEPRWKMVRSTSRFAKLAKKIGIPDRLSRGHQ